MIICVDKLEQRQGIVHRSDKISNAGNAGRETMMSSQQKLQLPVPDKYNQDFSLFDKKAHWKLADLATKNDGPLA